MTEKESILAISNFVSFHEDSGCQPNVKSCYLCKIQEVLDSHAEQVSKLESQMGMNYSGVLSTQLRAAKEQIGELTIELGNLRKAARLEIIEARADSEGFAKERDRLAERVKRLRKACNFIVNDARSYGFGEGELYILRARDALAEDDKLANVPERPICIACEKPISGAVIYDGDATATMHEQCPERTVRDGQ